MNTIAQAPRDFNYIKRVSAGFPNMKQSVAIRSPTRRYSIVRAGTC